MKSGIATENLDYNFITGVNSLRDRCTVFNNMAEELGQINFKVRSLNFKYFIKIIIGQQLSNAAATTIYHRLEKLFVPLEINPERFLRFDFEVLKKCGISSAKYNYICNIANIIIQNPKFFEQISTMRRNEAYNELCALKGVGPWTANIIQLFHFGDLGVFPSGDVSLMKVHKALFGCDLKSKQDYEEQLNWADPYRGVLALYYWDYLDTGSLKAELMAIEALNETD